MSVTLFDRINAVRNPFTALFLRQIATSDELFGVLPMVSKAGEAFSYEREVSLGNFNFIAPGGSVAKSNSKTERISVTKREATEDFEIDNFVLDNQSDGAIDPSEREAAMKAKAAGRAIASKLFTGQAVDTIAVEDWTAVSALVAASAFIRDREEAGELEWDDSESSMRFRAPGDRDFGDWVDMSGGAGNYTLKSSSPSKWVTLTVDPTTLTADEIRRIAFSSSTNSFEGLGNMMATDRTLSASYGTLDFALLDELYDAVKNRDGQVVYVMPLALRRKLLSLLRAVGGTEPQFVMSNGMMAPSFNGVPVLGNDWATAGEVWCMNLTDEGSGVWLAHFGGGTEIPEAADPREAPVLGFRLRDVGQNQSQSRNIWRLSWYGTPCLGSDLSIARAQGVTV